MFIFFIGCSIQTNTNNFIQEEIDYFSEIALGAEFGDEVPVIKKWNKNIRIKIEGEPTIEDLEIINVIISDLNELVSGIKIKIVEKKENLTITFSPESDFGSIDQNYIPTNNVFFGHCGMMIIT